LFITKNILQIIICFSGGEASLEFFKKT